ncbi:fused fructose-specific PTS enzymes [Serratia symbiotica str. 'Cinara cedri']|nr:fused fructose-specific PTS enzymes [Serratia symbiotica str. 'Cinara cedri']
MKTLLVIDSSLGQGRCYLAKRILEASLTKTGLMLALSLADAELVIIVGKTTLANAILNDKLVYIGELKHAIRKPQAFLKQAKILAKIYQAPNHIVTPVKSANRKHIVAITACPTGVAHTFMAAEAIKHEAKKRGWEVIVETRGSIGTGNTIKPEEVAAADLVIVAADIEVNLEKFAGKPIYYTSTQLALKKTEQELNKALVAAKIFNPQTQKSSSATNKKNGNHYYRHLLTGVSYMLPMVVVGGLCIALSFIFGIKAFEVKGTLAAALMQIGSGTAFALMVPVLSGFIAFSIADRPGQTPGLIGGMLAVNLGAGFLGGIIAGFLAGYITKAISDNLHLPQNMEALKPILIIPLLASVICGLMMIYMVGTPVAAILNTLTRWLQSLGTVNATMLGIILGAMTCSDMGGPINKAAYAFGVTLLSTSVYTPMAAIMAAGMVPPLSMSLATLLARGKFDKSARDSGKAALVMGLCFISEGAIPFTARDPLRVLPCCIIGGSLTGGLSMVFGAKLMAPHGGLFVLLIPGAITPILLYLVAIAVGTLFSGLTYALLKRTDALVVT